MSEEEISIASVSAQYTLWTTPTVPTQLLGSNHERDHSGAWSEVSGECLPKAEPCFMSHSFIFTLSPHPFHLLCFSTLGNSF